MLGNKRHDIIEKVSHGHHDYDYYGEYGMQAGATGNCRQAKKRSCINYMYNNILTTNNLSLRLSLNFICRYNVC